MKLKILVVRQYTPPPVLLKFGVPQGSILGPVLSVLHNQPLSQILHSQSVSHQLFADDTQSGAIDHFDQTKSRPQPFIYDAGDWVYQKKCLQLNHDKAKAHCTTSTASRTVCVIPLYINYYSPIQSRISENILIKNSKCPIKSVTSDASALFAIFWTLTQQRNLLIFLSFLAKTECDFTILLRFCITIKNTPSSRSWIAQQD